MNNPTDQNRMQTVGLEEAREKLRHLFAEAGLEFREPWTSAEAAKILRTLGYQAPNAIIGELTRKSYVGIENPKAIDAAEMFAVLIAMESRKRWAPYPNARHDVKKSQARLAVEKLQAEGTDEPINDLDRYTTEDLLLSICNADARWLRENLFEALRLKLLGSEE